jgi:hypothetical protein
VRDGSSGGSADTGAGGVGTAMPSDMTAAAAHEPTVLLIPGAPFITVIFELSSFELASFGLSSFEEPSEAATDDGLLEL